MHPMIISNLFHKQIEDLNFSGHNDDLKKPHNLCSAFNESQTVKKTH